MANRPVFIPDPSHSGLVRELMVDFQWHPGFALSQARKSIASLHAAAGKRGIAPVLEISSKSPEPLGVQLSAFNLTIEAEGNECMSIECAFQGSKVFERGGPYTDLYSVSSRQAKKDLRLQNSGEVVGFNFLGDPFPTRPLTAFYDWLYLQALRQHADLAVRLPGYRGFTDIAFNPQKSMNCQARSAALFVSLNQAGLFDRVLRDKQFYLETLALRSSGSSKSPPGNGQIELPL